MKRLRLLASLVSVADTAFKRGVPLSWGLGRTAVLDWRMYERDAILSKFELRKSKCTASESGIRLRAQPLKIVADTAIKPNGPLLRFVSRAAVMCANKTPCHIIEL